MPTINQLPLLAQVSPGDQFAVYTPNNGDARRLPVSSLLTYFEQTFASPTLAVNLYTPSTGFNIPVPSSPSEQQWILLQPAGTLAAGTITFPLSTGVPDGTEVLITSTQTITALTLGPNGASNIFGAVNTLSAGNAIRYRFYQPTNSWYAITTDPISTFSGAVQTFLANPTSANLAAMMSDETGTGLLVFNNTPNLVSPILGTPTSGTLTNCTGLPLSGVTGLGANMATFLATPSSANLAATVTDETGSGALVFANSPTLVTPTLGVATATSVTTGPVFGSVQSLTGPGAVNLTTYTTQFTSTGTGDALTLADGASGQIKNVVYVAQTAGADTGILTPANLGGYTTITFNDPGDSVQLQFIGTQWWVISAFGAVVA
jgi:hypothetical protein